MSANKIGDVNVVSDTGAVWSWVIVAEDLNMRSLPQSRLNCNFNQLSRGFGGLTRTALRISAGDVEVT